MGGGPVTVPEGKPSGPIGNNARKTADVAQEIALRAPVFDPNVCVSAKAFEEYYAMVSLGVHDDAVFFRTVLDVWDGRRANEEAQNMRDSLSARIRTDFKPNCARLVATMMDKSKRILVLRDDRGISEGVGHAGADGGQYWTWGGVKPEIIRRLVQQDPSLEGQIKDLVLTPF